MKDIVILEGDDLKTVLDYLQSAASSSGTYRLRFVVDGGGIKIKVNEYTWTPPYGAMDVVG